MRLPPRPALAAAVALLVPIAATARGQAAAVPPRATAVAIDSAVRALAGRPLWPRFDPLAAPLAVWTGTSTLLFRHPSPPAGYVSLSSLQGVWARPGRDAAVTANSSAPIGGVTTATLLLDTTATRSAGEWAAIAAHELFHVHQRQRHASWTANEADLFTYPVDDVPALALRREESFTLAEALASRDDNDEAACWGQAFTALRAARFARLGPAAAAYERGTELNEGLARFVELEAGGHRASIPPEEFPADEVRRRAYESGAAIATVLDQLAAGWRDSLEAAPASAALTLDGLLAARVAGRGGPGVPSCSARAEQRTAWAAAAAREVDSLAAARVRRRAAYVAQPGWSVVIDATAALLFPQGFDPLNVARLTDTDVLHTRFVQLGNAGARIEVLGRAALTSGGAGQHPLFNGVRRVVVTGLPAAPSLRDSSGVTLLSAEGLTGRFPRASVDVGAREVRVVLR